MADPQTFNLGYSYTDWQSSNPSKPLPGNKVDQDLFDASASIETLVDAVKDIRRADGKLKNQIVTVDSLSPQVAAGVGAGALASAAAAAASAEAAADSAQEAEASAGSAAGSAGTAATSAGQAMTYRNEAETQKTLAQTARTGAQTARDYAAQWASADEGVDVADGVNPVSKSAYHWAMVAEGAATGALPDGSVTTEKIADEAVTSEKIEDEAVASDKIAAEAVTRAKLAEEVTDELDGKQALSVYAAKSANYTALAADNNAVLRFTAAATLSLTAAATLGANWRVTVVANGGAVTIDPNGSETINGLATMIVPNGTSAEIICSGSAFFVVMKPAGWITLERRTFSGAVAVDFPNLGDFKDVRFRGVVNTSASTDLFWRSSTDNGATFDAAAAAYQNQSLSAISSTLGGARLQASYGRMVNALDACAFDLSILNLSGVVGGCIGVCTVTAFAGGAGNIFVQQTGQIRVDSVARNAIRFATTTGATLSGYIIAEGSPA